jgi:hypothetical protein
MTRDAEIIGPMKISAIAEDFDLSDESISKDFERSL